MFAPVKSYQPARTRCFALDNITETAVALDEQPVFCGLNLQMSWTLFDR
ncbi:hypothetical protein TRICHSKD4_0511 [Roseibium sp. TrichSKD4]|nr:hypothetical protein TRICHSKD4_0511 [Roseibium sp. TrichSKD4]